MVIQNSDDWSLAPMTSQSVRPSSPAALHRMKAVRRSRTKPEKLLCKALDELGLTYETDAQPLPESARKADILFRQGRVAVFVDGCFWHGCPLHGTQAKANAGFWREKIERNRERDTDTNRRLIEAGWIVVRIWEHDDPASAASKIQQILRNTTGSVR